TPSNSPRMGRRRSSTGRTTPCSRGRRDLHLDPLGGAARDPAEMGFELHLDRQAWLEVGDRSLRVRLPKQAPVQPDLRPLRDLGVHGPGGAGDRADLLPLVVRVKLLDDVVFDCVSWGFPEWNTMFGL